MGIVKFLLFAITIIFIFLATGSGLWWYELRKRNIPYMPPRPANTDEEMLDDIAASVGVRAFFVAILALLLFFIVYYTK